MANLEFINATDSRLSTIIINRCTFGSSAST
jgi:hypothetical protein